MEAAAVNHGPDHIPTSLGVDKPVGPQRCSSTPIAGHPPIMAASPRAVERLQEPAGHSTADQGQGLGSESLIQLCPDPRFHLNPDHPFRRLSEGGRVMARQLQQGGEI